MMRWIGRAARREDGIALLTSLLVVFVVFLLSTVVVMQAMHNVDASGYDQRRLQTVSAAEAGLNWAFNQMEFTDVDDLWTGTDGTPLSMDVGSGAVNVEVDVTYFADTEGSVAYDPATGTAANPPGSFKVVSTALTPTGVERTMESFAVLNPVYGGLDGAVITNSGITITNNFNLSGSSGNDGDIVVENGNFSAPSGVENIRGSVYVVNGTALVSTNSHIYGSVWAKNAVTVDHTQALIDLDAKSSNAGVTVSKGRVAGSAYYCTGSAPPSGAGIVNGSKIQTCSLGTPPTFGFPMIQFSQSAWQSFDYYIKDFRTGYASPCVSARSWLTGTGNNTYNTGTPITGGVPSSAYTGVVIITPSTCTFSMSSPPATENVNFRTNLAIVAYGGINVANNSTWTGVGGTKDLFFMSPYNGTSASCPTQNVTISNKNSFTSAEVSVYTVCTASVANNNTFPGQIIGATTNIQGNFTMTYRPVLIPGTDVVGFEQDVAYIREV